MEPTRSGTAERTATWYRERHLWSVRVVKDDVLLPMGHGKVAFDLPTGLMPKVHKALEHNSITIPVILVTKPEPRVVLLAETDDAVLGQCQMPNGVRFLTVPLALRLPLLAPTPNSDRKWLCPPDPGQRWLPAASAILTIISAASPWSSRVASRARRPAQPRTLIG